MRRVEVSLLPWVSDSGQPFAKKGRAVRVDDADAPLVREDLPNPGRDPM
jgi:hypothetical protein